MARIDPLAQKRRSEDRREHWLKARHQRANARLNAKGKPGEDRAEIACVHEHPADCDGQNSTATWPWRAPDNRERQKQRDDDKEAIQHERERRGGLQTELAADEAR